MNFKDIIRAIPGFPEPGVQFRDVNTLFGDARGFRMRIDMLLHPFATGCQKLDLSSSSVTGQHSASDVP